MDDLNTVARCAECGEDAAEASEASIHSLEIAIVNFIGFICFLYFLIDTFNSTERTSDDATSERTSDNATSEHTSDDATAKHTSDDETEEHIDYSGGSPHNIMDSPNTVARCAAECGEGGAGLKMCDACKHIKYCSVTCQRRHWPSHKKECKQRAAKLHDESLFKQPPPKEDCPICFLPMPYAYEEVAACCGKIVCRGCDYSWSTSGSRKCPFCYANIESENEIVIERTMKRVEANDVNSMTNLGCYYAKGSLGLQQDWNKALQLFTRAAELGSSTAHYRIGEVYHEGMGVVKDMKKAIHHLELAAMAGHEVARYNLGCIEYKPGNSERAIRHWTISASAGDMESMTEIQQEFEKGLVQTDVYELTKKAYNNSCEEMRSEAREDAAYLRK